MQQVFSSVPKKNPPLGAEKKLIFTSAKEDIAARFRLFSGGKIALVSDQGRFSLFRDFALSPRAICLILEDDALPLFSLPEGVCCVLAAGGRETPPLRRLPLGRAACGRNGKNCALSRRRRPLFPHPCPRRGVLR